MGKGNGKSERDLEREMEKIEKELERDLCKRSRLNGKPEMGFHSLVNVMID